MVKLNEKTNPESLSSFPADINCENEVEHFIALFLDKIDGDNQQRGVFFD